MLWILYTLLAALIWMGVDLFSKFVVDKELEDPALAAGTCGLSLFLMLALVSGFLRSPETSLTVVIPSMGVGVFYEAALLLYYSGIGKEEVSRFIPTLSTTTIFTVFLAFFLIGERFTLLVYLGIAAVIAGAVLISMEGWEQLTSKKGFALAISAAILFAFRNVSLKFATSQVSLWAVLFWAGIGGVVTSILFILFNFPKVKGGIFKGEKHLLEVGFLSAFGYFAYAKAISVGYVSLASAVLKIKILLVFLASTLLSRIRPKILREELDRFTILQKIVAIFLIISGVVLIHLFS